MSRKRVRFRCLDIQGPGFSMRVQTAEGDVSPETMKALLGIGKAAAHLLGVSEAPKLPKRLKGGGR